MDWDNNNINIGWNSWKLIARTTISLTPSLFGPLMPSIYSQGNTGKFRETKSGVGKNGALGHKSGNISETSKDRGKVTKEGPKDIFLWEGL